VVILNLRDLDLFERLERPPIPILGGGTSAFGYCGDVSRFWVRSAHSNPLDQQRNLAVVQPLLGRHFEIFVHLANRPDEQTSLWLAWDNRGTALATFEGSVARIEHKTAFYLVRLMAMAFEAIVRQNRLHLLLEKLDLLRSKMNGFGRANLD